MPSSNLRWLLALLPLLFGLLAHLNAINNPPLYDDHFLVESNTLLESQSVKRILTQRGMTDSPVFSHHFRPLLMLSYWTNMRLAPSISSFRAVNLALHLLCGLLVGVLVGRILERQRSTRRAAAATIATALFVLHPAYGEAVNLILKRNSSLSALLVMLALVAFDGTRKPGARRVLWWSLSLASGGAAIFVKESAVVMPALVWLYGARREHWQGRLLPGLKSAASFAVVPALYLCLWFPSAAIPQSWEPRLAYLFAQPAALLEYASVFFIPTWVAIAGGVDPSPWPPGAGQIAGAIVVVAALVAAVALRKRHPLLLFAALWAAICLAPSSSVVPLRCASDQIRIYLASLGFLALVAAGLLALGQKAADGIRRRRIDKRSVLALVTASPALFVCLCLFVSALANNHRRSDAVIAWGHAVEVHPDGHVANGNYCASLYHAGPRAAARRACQRALALDPGDPWVNMAVALIHHQDGSSSQAEQVLAAARRRIGERWQLSLAEGYLAWSNNDCVRAEKAYARVLTAYPANTHARLRLADCLVRRGSPEARALIAPMQKSPPRDPGDRRLLSSLSRRLGKPGPKQ